MKTLRFFSILLCLFILIPLHAQNDGLPPVIFTVTDYIKVKPGMAGEYFKLEQAWKKIHMARMEDDKLLNWVVYRAATNVGSDYEYNAIAVSLYNGPKQLAGSYEIDKFSAYENVLTKEELELVNRTSEIRELVREEVYVLSHSNVNTFEGFPEVQWMQFLSLNKGSKMEDFMKVEKQLGSQLDKALIKEGALLNSQVYERKLPSGSSADFDVVRVFAYNDIEHMLAFPAKLQAMRAKLNPGYAGLDAKFGNVSLVKEEMWMKVICACDEE